MGSRSKQLNGHWLLQLEADKKTNNKETWWEWKEEMGFQPEAASKAWYAHMPSDNTVCDRCMKGWANKPTHAWHTSTRYSCPCACPGSRQTVSIIIRQEETPDCSLLSALISTTWR